jgi:hypothetical protein
MPMTLMQAAIRGGGLSKGEIATISYFDRVSRVLEDLPFKKIDGKAYPYNIEAALPGVAWRDVNEAYSESTGVILPKVEQLHILGGDVFIDNFLWKTEPANSPSLRAQEFELKAKALAIEFDRAFFEGDDLVSDKEMVGLRRRLTGGQVMLAGSGGATLTLAMLDQLLDLVPFDGKILYMNRTLRRKVTSLVNAASGSARITYTQDVYGRQNTMYGEVPIRIIESQGDASTILDFDEDPGDATADTASIYVVAPGMDRIHGIYNGNAKLVDVHLVAQEMESKPGLLGRIEGFYGMAIPHPRAAARLRGVTNT